MSVTEEGLYYVSECQYLSWVHLYSLIEFPKTRRLLPYIHVLIHTHVYISGMTERVEK